MKKQMKWTGASLLAMATLLLLGPVESRAQGQSSAVVDMDIVAKELGISQALEDELKGMETNINSQLKDAQNKLQAQFDEAKDKLGIAPTEDQKAQLGNLNREMTVNLLNARDRAQAAINQTRVARILQFRDKVKTYALKAAQAKGYKVVLVKSEMILDYDPSVDISVDIAKLMQADNVTPESVWPKLPAPATGAAPANGTAPAPAPAAPAAPKANP